jgi:hypothetical protein
MDEGGTIILNLKLFEPERNENITKLVGACGCNAGTNRIIKSARYKERL